MDRIKKLFWKLNNKKKRLVANVCSWILTRQSKAFMKRMNFRNIRRNLGRHNGLFVVAYICTDYPFYKGKLNVAADNVIDIIQPQNPCDANQEDVDKCRGPYSNKVQDTQIH
ncbi:MAG: hypothetical protein IJ982_01130 [Fibrobacter sp.]|nr:hypothetical protein [Fibrobacter sp.]